jgi:hypothetical protein
VRTTLNMPSLAASLRRACSTSPAIVAASSGRDARARLRVKKLAIQPARKAAATNPNTISCSLVNPWPFPLLRPPR